VNHFQSGEDGVGNHWKAFKRVVLLEKDIVFDSGMQ